MTRIRPLLLIACAALIGSLSLASRAGHAQAAPAGPALFKQRCAMCHSVAQGKNGLGPSLAGVSGRKAAAIAGFAYSPAMKKSGLTWAPKQLDAFLAAPQKLVPGTRMPLGVPDATQRAALIAYLATQK